MLKQEQVLSGGGRLGLIAGLVCGLVWMIPPIWWLNCRILHFPSYTPSKQFIKLGNSFSIKIRLIQPSLVQLLNLDFPNIKFCISFRDHIHWKIKKFDLLIKILKEIKLFRGLKHSTALIITKIHISIL